ncbi:MAG: hypothetical protein IID63_05115 [candidate division Zixibacteria bacterium]|nr:hypothetical protein [candidate division Zixibacteria bacterium]
MKQTLTLEKVDILQIQDGLTFRADVWQRTVAYFNGDYVDGDIAECSDLHEAETILAHYQEIIKSINQQTT